MPEGANSFSCVPKATCASSCCVTALSQYQGMKTSSLCADGEHEGAQVHGGLPQGAILQVASVPNLRVTRKKEAGFGDDMDVLDGI